MNLLHRKICIHIQHETQVTESWIKNDNITLYLITIKIFNPKHPEPFFTKHIPYKVQFCKFISHVFAAGKI